MKKNAMLKVAAVLLVAVLLTTCAISSTFAKYVTENVSESVDARVAAWGVEVRTNFLANNNLFKNAYGTYAEGTAGDVKGIGTDTVVAPGTANSITVASLATGTPEVSGKITATATLDLGDKWTVGGTDYCPLVFTVGTTDYKIDGVDIKTVDELEVAVKEAIETAGTKYFKAGTNLEDAAFSFVIGWSWNFENGDDNVKDTALADSFLDTEGNIIAANAPKVNLTIEVGVVQTAS